MEMHARPASDGSPLPPPPGAGTALSRAPAGRRQRRSIDQREDLGQAPMRRWCSRLGAAGAHFVHDELRRRHTGAQHALGADLVARHGEAAERARQLLERQARVEERAERHVARNAGETVEIQNARHHIIWSFSSGICHSGLRTTRHRTFNDRTAGSVPDVSVVRRSSYKATHLFEAAVPHVAQDDVIHHVDAHQRPAAASRRVRSTSSGLGLGSPEG